MTANQLAYQNLLRQTKKDEADIDLGKARNAIETAKVLNQTAKTFLDAGHNLGSNIIGAVKLGM